jgi:hypothetical protein
MVCGALVLAVATILATYSARDSTRSLWGESDRHGAATTLSGILIFVLLAASVQSPKHSLWLLLASVAGSAPVCIYGIVQLLRLDPLPWQTDSISPLLSTLGRSNFLAAYLAVLIPLTAVLAWRAYNAHARGAVVFAGLLLTLQATCLLAAQARAGWLAVTAGMAVFFFLALHPTSLVRAVCVALLFVAASASLFVFAEWVALQSPATFLPVSQSTGDTAAAKPSAVSTPADFAARRVDSIVRRMVIWRSTPPLLGERWLLGHGPAGFAKVFNTRYSPGSLYTGNDIWIDDPHNLPLELLIDLGVAGLASWLLVLAGYGTVLVTAARTEFTGLRHQLTAGLAGAMTAYLTQALFNPDVVTLTLLFWLLCAMAAGIPWESNSIVPTSSRSREHFEINNYADGSARTDACAARQTVR